MGRVDTLDMLVVLHPTPFKSKRWYTGIIWGIFDLIAINSWILMKSRRGDSSHDSPNHGYFRLFHFKSEIAKCLLRKPKLQRLPLATVDSIPDDDEENEPPTKKDS